MGAQKEALDKLFKRVDVPLDREPQTALGELFGKAKDIGGPRTGSSSAQFHMYRASRRKEYERLEGIEKSATEVCLMPAYVHQV